MADAPTPTFHIECDACSTRAPEAAALADALAISRTLGFKRIALGTLNVFLCAPCAGEVQKQVS
jgi:hypothetical protein